MKNKGSTKINTVWETIFAVHTNEKDSCPEYIKISEETDKHTNELKVRK